MKPRPHASINGPRPYPLMINTDSHSIRKPSSSSPSSDIVSMNQVRKPIIIYTHSPKVIHTKAQDFMSLVQRLTGKPRRHRQGQNDVVLGSSTMKDQANSNSTTTTGDHDGGNEITSLALGKNPNYYNNKIVEFNYGVDVPIFTPNSSVYKYNSCDSNSPFGFLGSLISPSALEFIKDLPDY